jgi:hypothetical protein
MYKGHSKTRIKSRWTDPQIKTLKRNNPLTHQPSKFFKKIFSLLLPHCDHLPTVPLYVVPTSAANGHAANGGVEEKSDEMRWLLGKANGDPLRIVDVGSEAGAISFAWSCRMPMATSAIRCSSASRAVGATPSNTPLLSTSSTSSTHAEFQCSTLTRYSGMAWLEEVAKFGLERPKLAGFRRVP